MRCFYQNNYRDNFGNVIPDGRVTVYLSGTTTLATVFETLTGTVGVNYVTTDEYGFFSFYVDRFDYDWNQTFRLSCTKTGYATIVRENIDVPAVYNGTYDITSNEIIGTRMNVPPGVIYNISGGISMTFTGAFEAGDYEIFTGTGTVVFSSDSIIEYNPVWFGTGVTATIANAVNGIKVLVAPLRPMLRATDPDTSGWGLAHLQLWATLEGTRYILKMWNGEEIVLVG